MKLSPRKLQILTLVAKGFTDKEIALDKSLTPELKARIFILRKKGEDALKIQILKDLKPKMV